MSTSQDQLCFTPAVELIQLIKQREISPVEVVEAVINRIDRLDSKVNAFITRTDDLARQAAVEAERLLRTDGPDALPALAGLPLSIKDNTDTAGIRTTYGSGEFASHVPDEDAHISARIRAAGAAIIGKTSTPAFGWLGTTTNDLVGTTNNPWKLSHSVGGSSGGSGAALAAGFGPLSTGSDGGGSIRIPSSLCGIVGLKPSHGRIPRGNESALFDTVDALGPMARTVADVALLFSVMAGPSEDEPYMLPEENVDYVADLRAHQFGRPRIAVCCEFGIGGVDPEIGEVVMAAARHFERTFGALVDVIALDLPDPMEYFNMYYPVTIKNLADTSPAMIAHKKRYGLAEFCDQQAGVASHDWYTAVTAARERSFRAIAGTFRSYDLLLTPTSPVAAFPHKRDHTGPDLVNGNPVRYPALDFFRFTEPTGHSGHPSLSINCGFTSRGLPVGLQIIASQRNDKAVLRAGAAYEATTSWTAKQPDL